LLSSPGAPSLPGTAISAGRCEPQIAEAAPEGNPAQLIRETLALEREITAGLEKLLKEIEE
jgi:type I restriction enzyme M protein